MDGCCGHWIRFRHSSTEACVNSPGPWSPTSPLLRGTLPRIELGLGLSLALSRTLDTDPKGTASWKSRANRCSGRLAPAWCAISWICICITVVGAAWDMIYVYSWKSLAAALHQRHPQAFLVYNIGYWHWTRWKVIYMNKATALCIFGYLPQFRHTI